MGILARLLGRRVGRNRGVLAEPRDEERKTSRLPQPPPTRGTRRPQVPEPTPTTRPLTNPGSTAGTRSYGAPRGTPSTERIHNSPRPGR